MSGVLAGHIITGVTIGARKVALRPFVKTSHTWCSVQAHSLRSSYRQQCRKSNKDLRVRAAAESTPEGPPKLTDTELKLVRAADGALNSFPDAPGVYGVFNQAGELQYVGLSRKVSATIAGYSKDLPDLTHSVKVASSSNASREQLIGLWRSWMQEAGLLLTSAVHETGKVPPGNNRDNGTWAPKKPQKQEIKLTPGKGAQDLSCSISDLIDQVVKSNKVVAFVKGTRMQPQCGFSYKVLSTLNELGTNYEVLNVLDEVYNPGLRDAIKDYSQWPTIPQLYVDGEFVGGADIVEEMHKSGELKQMLGA